MSDENQSRRGRRVEWDEDNLEKNAEYQRLHPVTMHIDEPKTPYVHMDDDVAEAMDRGEDLSWDPKINALARQVKEKVANEMPAGPTAPVAKGGRPMLHPKTITGELEEEQHEQQFKEMRKAVYADEGARFRALLAKQREEDEEEEEEGNEKPTTAHSSGHPAAPKAQKDAALTEKERAFKAKGEVVHLQRMPDVEQHQTVATPLKHRNQEKGA